MRKRPREAILPMISIVFLLLMFFLMSASFVTPPPFDVRLPEGVAAEDAGSGAALYVARDGTLVLGDATGEAVFDAIMARGPATPLELRADANLPAAEIASLLSRLTELGVGETRLVLERP
ncbi:MAG: biopolymer transporter ExbD [Pseudomonadota bacterium]